MEIKVYEDVCSYVTAYSIALHIHAHTDIEADIATTPYAQHTSKRKGKVSGDYAKHCMLLSPSEPELGYLYTTQVWCVLFEAF